MRSLFTALTISFLGFITNVSGQTLVLNSGDLTTINVDTYYASITINNGGTLIVNGPAVLTVGVRGTPVATLVLDIQSGGIVTVDPGATVVVNGLLNNSSNQTAFNGSVQVRGNYTGATSSGITGSGTLNTTGTIITSNIAPAGLVFGNDTDCSTGPCSGTNLCSYANTIASYVQYVCSGGVPVMLDGNAIPPTVTYQWQLSFTSDGGFTNVSGATAEDYTPVAAIVNTTYYRRTATVGGCMSNSPQQIATIVQPAIVTIINTTSNYTIPANIKSVRVQVWGGGGGGSKGYAGLKGTGGGGGGYSEKIITVTPGDVINLTVGTGGAGASVSGDGNPGNVSEAIFGAMDLIATGGSGGYSTSAPTGTGGTGGSGSGGDLNYTGGSGANLSAATSSSPGGAAGAGAGTVGNGSNAGNSSPGGGSSGGYNVIGGGGSGGDGGATGNVNGEDGAAQEEEVAGTQEPVLVETAETAE